MKIAGQETERGPGEKAAVLVAGSSVWSRFWTSIEYTAFSVN